MSAAANNVIEAEQDPGAVNIWQVKQTPLDELRGGPGQGPPGYVPVKHSLAADKPEYQPIGTSHNVAPKPFLPAGITHNEYNSPINIYSDQNVQDTLVQQTQAMNVQDTPPAPPPGQKQQYDPTSSKTWQLLQEQDKQPEPSGFSRSVQAPTTDYAAMEKRAAMEAKAGGAPICAGCGRNIIGVFVKANDKTVHPECFNCTTCGSSLKNVGYWEVDDKLYCELHYRQKAARGTYGSSPASMPAHAQAPVNAPAPAPAATSPRPAPSFAPSWAQPRPAPTQQPVSTPWRPSSSAPKPHTPGGQKFTWPPVEGDDIGAAPYQNATSNYTAPAPAPAPASHAPSWTAPSYQPPAPAPAPAPMLSAPGGVSSAPSSRYGSTGVGPRRGRGVMNQPGAGRVPVCSACGGPIRGPFIAAIGKTWCPEHFICANARCRVPLQNIGFVEENGQLYCEKDYEMYFAPRCSKCARPVVGDCLNAMERQWHPDCFICGRCGRSFGNDSFYVEDGIPYCEKDWNEMFTTKCHGCGYSIEAGDHWVEALGNNYHSQCFKCTVCHCCLEGQSFYAKGGRPYCKRHATGSGY